MKGGDIWSHHLSITVLFLHRGLMLIYVYDVIFWKVFSTAKEQITNCKNQSKQKPYGLELRKSLTESFYLLLTHSVTLKMVH